MAEPSVSSPRAPARRRRRRYGAGAVVVALLLLIGRGLGLLGGAPEPQQGTAGAAAAGSQQHVAADVAAADRSAAPGRVVNGAAVEGAAVEGAAVERPAVPAGEMTAAASPTGSAAIELTAGGAPVAIPSDQPHEDAPQPAAGVPGMARDRFASRLSLVEQRLDDGQLGTARASLEHLQQQQLDDGQRQQLVALAGRIETVAAELGGTLVAQLQRGEVLAAAGTAEQLVVAGEARLARWLSAAESGSALSTEQLPADWLQALAPGDDPLPVAVPVARNRRVRLQWRDELHLGGVVSSRSDQVTVRIQTESGQSYPTVPTVACEPVEAAAAEAIEMGLVAVHAGEPLLARLWFVRALLVADGPLGERGQRLAELLR